MANKTYIVIRTQREGFHRYPDASKIDPRIAFLENVHRHMFKITAKIEVFHGDRELEFYLTLWKINELLDLSGLDFRSCEMIASKLLEDLQNEYGVNRYMEITVSEDGESDGIVEYTPAPTSNDNSYEL